MRIIKKINKVSNQSSGIIIDKKYMDFFKLKDNDMVEIKLKKMLRK